MKIGKYDFNDPIKISGSESINRAVVYVVMTHNTRLWSYLYVGQAGDVSERFDNHEKWACWLRNKQQGGLYVALLLVPNRQQRLDIETELRNSLPGLPCNQQ